jgi:Lysophospholipase L1 and related esterases
MPPITKIKSRRGSASQWSSTNPTLDDGELGWDSTAKRLKVGDGTTAWNSLPFADDAYISAALALKADKTAPTYSHDGFTYNLKPEHLRRTRAVLGRAMAQTGYARFAFVGDSTVVGAYGGNTGTASWPARFVQFLEKSGYIKLGTGLVPCFNNYAAAEPRIILYSGMVPTSTFSNMVQNTTNTNGVQFDTTSTGETGTVMDVFYDNASSPFDVNIDGGARVRVTPSGGSTIGVYSVSGLSNSTHQAIAWRVSGTMRILGFRLRADASFGIDTYNAAISGAKTDSIASSNYQHVMQTAASTSGWSADCTFIMCETNDAGNATPVATFKANLQSAINTAKAQNADVILLAGFPLNGVDLTTYTAALYALSDSNNVPLIDMQARWGTWAQASALGLFTDNAHPTAAGYADAGRVVFNTLHL